MGPRKEDQLGECATTVPGQEGVLPGAKRPKGGWHGSLGAFLASAWLLSAADGPTARHFRGRAVAVLRFHLTLPTYHQTGAAGRAETTHLHWGPQPLNC